MKKLLLFILVLTGIVNTASAATTRIFIQPDDWAASSAVLKVNLYYSGSYKSNYFLTNSDLYKTGIYYLDIDETQVNQFQLCRIDPNNSNNQWNYSGNISISGSKYYMMGNVENGKTNVTISTYLPCNYYFVSDKSGTWKQVGIMTETSGTYTYTFDTDDYSGKYFAWCTGDALSADGTLSNWSQVYASSGAGGSAQDMGFLKINYPEMYQNQNGQRWRVLSTLTDANINISYTPSSNSAVVSAYRTTTIGTAGYTTWSNDEKFEIDGTNVDDVYVVSADGTNEVTLTSEKGKIFPGTVSDVVKGVIIKGSGEVKINAVASGATVTATATNYLVGSGNSAKSGISATAGKTYVFSWDGTNASSVGFYKASGSGSLAAHKAYLELPSTSPARDFLAFDFGNATGINAIDNGQLTIDNNAPMYNLAGQRVNKSYKGVVIVNGKKMLNK